MVEQKEWKMFLKMLLKMLLKISLSLFSLLILSSQICLILEENCRVHPKSRKNIIIDLLPRSLFREREREREREGEREGEEEKTTNEAFVHVFVQ